MVGDNTNAMAMDTGLLVESVKAGAVTGGVAGLYSMGVEGRSFITPALTLGGIASVVHYAAADLDPFYTSLAVGGAAGGLCKVMMPYESLEFCVKYGAISGGAAYVAQRFVAPRLAAYM